MPSPFRPDLSRIPIYREEFSTYTKHAVGAYPPNRDSDRLRMTFHLFYTHVGDTRHIT